MSEIGVIIAIIGVIAFTIYFILFIKRDYESQIIVIEGKEYRKKYGLLSENGNYIKEKLWLKQKEYRINPINLKKTIKITDYSSNCNCIIQKKGL